MKTINNMDLKYLDELEADINYSQTNNSRYIKNELKNLFDSVKKDGIKKLKAGWSSEEQHILCVVNPEMTFLIKYCIRKDNAGNFTIKECNEGVPF